MKKLIALLPLVALVACSSSDGGSSGHTTPPGSFAFHPDAAPSSASVTLRQKELGGGKLVLELVGHGLTDVYGVAFRLKYDPSVLTYASLDAGPVVSGGQHVALGSAQHPGLLVGVATEKGKNPGAAADDEVLATLTFQLGSEHPTQLQFVTTRSGVVSAATGEPMPGITFVGGNLE